jgi:hypothetical protein
MEAPSMFRQIRQSFPTALMSAFCAAALIATACGGEEAAKSPAAKAAAAKAPAAAKPAPPAASKTPSTPDELPLALVMALASFGVTEGGGAPAPLPARLEFLVRTGGKWKVTSLDDEQSNVFHKAMAYTLQSGEQRLLSAAGSAAIMKLWEKGDDGPHSETLWEQDFGGKFSRMRDVEVADVYGDGAATMVIATHDQGIVATLRPNASGGFDLSQLDQEPNTFVHEIEIGDLNGDGTLEVYATPSEPNRLDGTPQSGQVVRYVPKTGEGRKIVADLGDRHAKEILVEDVDGDGTDELYVVVEGATKPGSQALDKGVEIRRYEADTPPAEGVVIAEIRDRLCRFLTAGDIDGDGKKELVAAAFSSGLWLLRPGADPNQKWTTSSIDRDSSGFEHAAILADLDEDGSDELYVASDKHKQVRRYVWNGSRLAREVIFRRSGGGSVFTWNLMPVPASLVP